MRPQRALEIVLFVWLLASFSYFHHLEPGWNVNSRLDLTFALVEHHTVTIDEYFSRPETKSGDAALYNGHHYSDKIIGVSLIGVPAYWIVKAASSIFDVTLTTPAKRYWITVLAIGLPGAISGVFLFRLLILLRKRFGGNYGDGVAIPFIISLATYLGTLLFCYSTLFMSYLPAHAFIIGSLYVLFKYEGDRGRRALLMLFLCGLLAGLSVLCEYLYAIVAGLLAIYIVVNIRPRWAVCCYIAGGFLGVLPFLIYTYSIFGKLSIPYQYHMMPAFRRGMGQGLMGATWPKPAVLVMLTLHPFRGIFVQSPMLLLGAVGAVAMLRSAATRVLGTIIIIGCAVDLLYTSAYYMWWGGWTFSPRHLSPMLALLPIAMQYACRWRSARILLPPLVALAIFVHLVVTATDPQVPEPRNREVLHPVLGKWSYPVPFLSQVWPAFRAGRTDPNIGTMTGLSPGFPSLIPLLLFWCAAIAVVVWQLRRSPQT